MRDHAATPNGAEVLLQCLVNHGVDTVFAYPGGATLPIHQALTRVSCLRTILPRHEAGGGFAAIGYARSSGKVGVCFATSGPGATNLVPCLADAQRHAVPLVAITGQANSRVLGTDAFQEIPIVSLCRAITKHHYLVTKAEDMPRVMIEALHIATTGRPGPVIVDVPKDLQIQRFTPDYTTALNLPGYGAEGQVWADEAVCLGEPTCAAEAVLARLCDLLEERGELDDTFLTTGTGLAQTWTDRAYRFPTARHRVASDSLGAIGFALASALGVQVAHPDARVIAVDTTDHFVSHVQELACAHCEGLPVKVLVLGPASYPDVTMLAHGFGVAARAVDGNLDLDGALPEWLDATGPALLDVRLPTNAPGRVPAAGTVATV